MLTEVSSPKKEGKASLKAHTHRSLTPIRWCTTRNYFGFGRLHCLMCQDGYFILFFNFWLEQSQTCTIYASAVQEVLSPFVLKKKTKKKEKGGGKNRNIISSQYLPKTRGVYKLLTPSSLPLPPPMTAPSCPSSCTVHVFKGKKRNDCSQNKAQGGKRPGWQEERGAVRAAARGASAGRLPAPLHILTRGLSA